MERQESQRTLLENSVNSQNNDNNQHYLEWTALQALEWVK